MGAACCDSSESIRPAQPTGSVGSKKPMGSAIKIEYFPASYARPDPIIQLLEHKGVNYEKVEINFEAWGARKAAGDTGEFGGMPIVHQAGKSRQ